MAPDASTIRERTRIELTAVRIVVARDARVGVAPGVSRRELGCVGDVAVTALGRVVRRIERESARRVQFRRHRDRLAAELGVLGLVARHTGRTGRLGGDARDRGDERLRVRRLVARGALTRGHGGATAEDLERPRRVLRMTGATADVAVPADERQDVLVPGGVEHVPRVL